MNWFGEKFSLKVCPDDVFGFSGVAGCPERTATVCSYFCPVRKIAGAARVCDFFYFHPSFPPSCGVVTAAFRLRITAGCPASLCVFSPSLALLEARTARFVAWVYIYTPPLRKHAQNGLYGLVAWYKISRPIRANNKK